ncbi:MAG TPA: hypothetical protein VK615_04400 [Candidatus Binatia bacterium]|nr:hypothetical protein [Candidatus Binatia bacterium]
MSYDEYEILEFLKKFEKVFVSPVEIAKRVGGRQRFHENRDWARPILYRLFVEGLLEADEYGHYRLVPEARTKAKPASQKCFFSFGQKTYVLDDDEPFAFALAAFRPKNF